MLNKNVTNPYEKKVVSEPENKKDSTPSNSII
jgi:hypothetical protein